MSRLSLGIAGWVEKTSSKAVPAGAVLLSAVILVACGESSQDKAKADVCAARSEISKQITKLQGLTLSSNAVNEIKSSFEKIDEELTKIKDAQGDLEPARKERVEAATKKFEGQLKTIASEVTSGLVLRSKVLNDQKKVIEQYTFTELKLGSHGVRSDLKSIFEARIKRWMTDAQPREEATARRRVGSSAQRREQRHQLTRQGRRRRYAGSGKRFEWRERLAEFHRGALAFGAPMIFVDAIAQEHNTEPLRKRRRRCRSG